MYGYLKEEDILVIIYPNKFQPEMVIILDPYGGKVAQYRVTSIEEVKKVLEKELPFCSQNHEPIIHLGSAHVHDWTDLPESLTTIKRPGDIEKIIE